ncbi:MAG: ATP phosphoribosyltransferase [Gammaproteobacteria bacterium]|nr:ATP phosphoribosyltransferase [Gammaproteobacteria bacterium]
MRVNNVERLKIAVQKSGRLTENSLELIARCGVKFSRDQDYLICFGENMPVDLLLVRDDDIPSLLDEGTCELGIVGANVAEEARLEWLREKRNSQFDRVGELDFGGCRLSIAVPQDTLYSQAGDLNGKRIATSYPELLRQFLEQNNVSAEIVTLSGAVEIAPRLGKADYICDLVSSGATLRANRLVEAEEVYSSNAAVYRSTRPLSADKQALLEKIIRRINGVMQVNGSKYIMLHAPRNALDEITRLLPGAESPTILPLEGGGDKVAVHAVCRESVFWETLESLKGAGASAVLVLPVEKMLA